MRSLVLFMHVSLDGFVAGPKGEMDWITVTDDVFAYAGARTDSADTALYGRVTWEMMQSYWPTAAEQPNATAHDIQHSQWYNSVTKVVVSRTLPEHPAPGTTVIGTNLPEQVRELKRGTGGDILMFGSVSVAHALMAENLIDHYWSLVNPVLLGAGLPLYHGIRDRIGLTTVEGTTLPSGVVCLHHAREAQR